MLSAQSYLSIYICSMLRVGNQDCPPQISYAWCAEEPRSLYATLLCLPCQRYTCTRLCIPFNLFAFGAIFCINIRNFFISMIMTFLHIQQVFFPRSSLREESASHLTFLLFFKKEVPQVSEFVKQA